MAQPSRTMLTQGLEDVLSFVFGGVRFPPITVRHLTPYELVLVGLSGYQTLTNRLALGS